MAPNPYSHAGESAADLWFEQSNFVGTVLGGIAYGVHLTVYSMCAYRLVSSHRHKRGQRNVHLLIFITIMLAMATLNLAGYTKLGEEAWIDKRDGPGGPMGWLTTECVGQSCVMGYYGYIVANFMADGLLIWRTCIIWDSYLIVLLPCLMYFASTALSIVSVYQIAKPGDNIWSDTTISFGIPYMALSISLNIVLTLLIVARLMYISNTVRTVLGAEHSGTYTFVATAMVESAAPYSITSIFFIILYGRHSNIQNLVLPVLAQIMCISPELIILRVARGRAWKGTTLSGSSNTTRGGSRTILFRRNTSVVSNELTSSKPLAVDSASTLNLHDLKSVDVHQSAAYNQP